MTRDEGRQASAQRLERAIGAVLRAGVTISSLCLIVGLVWAIAAGNGGVPSLLLQIGIVVLLGTPAARVVVSIAEYVVEGDWRFAALTGIVLLELLASAVAALVFNRRL
jgi:uncharacterized membrane protein